MMQVTEDTPPDMLAGAMDLTIHLPNPKEPPVKMSVSRSTPMMDLLVQVTTAHRLQPSAHIIQALGYAPNQGQSDVILPYKPNTPIGTLDTKHIKIIPKSPTKYLNNKNSSSVLSSAGISQRDSLQRGMSWNEQLPFENTFRLQVHLPRNQLFVARVSQYVMLESIMKKVCTEKNLDEKKYEFRHPANLNEVLDPKLTLSDYQLTEVSVVQKGKTISASDINMAALQREEERRRQQGRNGGGVFNLIFKRNKGGMGSGSVSSDTRSISPTRSDSSQSRSITPPAIQTIPKIIEHVEQEKPKAPARKRRPAPKPPTQQIPLSQQNSNDSSEQSSMEPQIVPNTKDIDISSPTGLTISHSRNSSDSSGYHEASILSDTINMQTLPRKNKTLTASSSSINQSGNAGTLPTHFEEKLKNGFGNHSKSTSNLTMLGPKKKRAPPPPPALKSSVSVCNLTTPGPPVVPLATTTPHNANINIAPTSLKSGSVTPNSTKISIASTPTILEPPTTENIKFIEPEIVPNIPDKIIPPKSKEITAIIALEPVEPPLQFTEPLSINTSSTNSIEIKSDINSDPDWQYQLPSPPTAFRDSSPINTNEIIPSINEYSKSDISTPELFEKLEHIHNYQSSQSERSETTTITSEPDRDRLLTSPPEPFSGTEYLSIEALERRKSQFLEKELASLKPEPVPGITRQKSILINELEEVIHNPKVKVQSVKKEDYNSLPNFKLTTYDQPKRVINIFEDDSIHSNVDMKIDSRNAEVKRGISEREMNIMNTIQNEFKKPVVVEIKKKSDFRKSQEILQARRQSIENICEKSNGIHRSDSFNVSNMLNASEGNPVKRSKSHLSLNKYKQSLGKDDVDGVRKTSSQWDISELQSLQVMRTILPKISNSQPPSPEREIQTEPFLTTQLVNHAMITQREKTPPVYEPTPKQAPTTPEPVKLPEPKTSEPVKTNENAIIPEKKVFRYSPPSINLSTWSERPKSQVALKSDSDYVIGDANKPRVELNQFQQKALQKPSYDEKPNSNGGYYRFQNIKRMPRPHSIAFESYQDLSHVPIVRSVELKKPIREEPEAMTTQTLNRNIKPFYKSSEQINQSQTLDRNNEYNSVLRNIQRFSANDTGAVKVARGNSFGFNRNSLNLNPVVKGFRSSEDTCRVTVNGVSQTFGKSEIMAPPPMPPPALKPISNKRVTKVVEDPRDQLLDAIRCFGKSNLKPVRY